MFYCAWCWKCFAILEEIFILSAWSWKHERSVAILIIAESVEQHDFSFWIQGRKHMLKISTNTTSSRFRWDENILHSEARCGENDILIYDEGLETKVKFRVSAKVIMLTWFRKCLCFYVDRVIAKDSNAEIKRNFRFCLNISLNNDSTFARV